MNENIPYHSPDEFMFSEFTIHSSIFHKQNKYDYFMISSGTNQFPLSGVWKESLHQEITSDYLYRWYTCAEGFQTATRSLKIYEDYLASKGDFFPSHFDNNICMTIGGSGAASLVFDYLKWKYKECDVILVGMNYSLYERLSQKNGFTVIELLSTEPDVKLPQISDFKRYHWSSKKKVFIFTNPNNPTGYVYPLDDFRQIVKYIKSIDGYIVWDKVCDLVISSKEYAYFENILTNNLSWNDAVVVNSFSKTDATAGFRIGYVYGNRELINKISDIQAGSIMNPPTFPVFAIALTCMFRCMFLNRCNKHKQYNETLIRNLFKNIFFYTGAIIPPDMCTFAKRLFDDYLQYYDLYVSEMINNEKIIHTNYLLTLEILKPFISHHSEMHGGFNFCVWFNRPFRISELDLVQQLLNSTGVAILTESAFSTLSRRNGKNYFIRFSAACNPVEYKRAVYRMKCFFESGGVFID